MDSSADSYTFSIPASVTIDPVTQYGYGTVTLKSGWTLVSVNGIKLNISNVANGVNNGYKKSSIGDFEITSAEYQNFTLTTADGETATYAIQASGLKPFALQANSYTISNGSTYVCSTAYDHTLINAEKGGDNTTDQTCELTFYVQTMPAAGVYTDTITFAITTY